MTRTTEPEHAEAGVPYANCHICPEARDAAVRVLSSGWVTAGAQTVAFERELGDWVGAAETVAVSSCTAAIELSLRALGLPPGAPVLTPTLTFCGAVHAIVHSGLRPVLVDTDEATLTVNAETVAEAATRVRPAAMVIQHMAGFPVEVREIAAAAGLPLDRVVEDAAHGLGAAVAGEPVGTVSRATCFSFYATKNLPIGEGGAVTTADADFAGRLREMRQHGMSRDAWRRYHPGGGWRYAVDSDGMKANFTDLQAAIGRAQLTHLTDWQRRRARLAARYDAALADVPGIVLPPRRKTGAHAWHLYVIRVGPDYGRSRDELIAGLTERGIGTSVHFVPVHQFDHFRRILGRPRLPVADRVADQLLSLPLHPQLSDVDVDRVVAHVAALGRRTGGHHGA
ncbi:DegT/DnrJ/EryC1/StrS family aminotransferase [Fodinicola acaciae]|uniref:DegT/DnrJ/EryC1/StrS family aminotransferase n=1 Tax=Fodinicola acaciae TaxID=2681555 RepID=UPI0013D3C43B|nr:DegT/DnrJ/EryC1/StrS family aminotransferase [Fodinicola acaciae]